MATWEAGPNYVMVPRGSQNNRHGGVHDGPSGYRRKKWIIKGQGFGTNLQNSKAQSDRDKAKYLEMLKSGQRPAVTFVSPFIRKDMKT